MPFGGKPPCWIKIFNVVPIIVLNLKKPGKCQPI
jgi:hypothetical protein